MSPPIETTLIKLSALKATVDACLSGDISNTGRGAERTRGYLRRFSTHVEELRTLSPELFGHIPKRNWSISIAGQAEALRIVERDMREIFVLATNAGLWDPAKMPNASIMPPIAAKRSWITDHLWQLGLGLLGAYLVYRFGWN